jgi:hypothetical protein
MFPIHNFLEDTNDPLDNAALTCSWKAVREAVQWLMQWIIAFALAIVADLVIRACELHFDFCKDSISNCREN